MLRIILWFLSVMVVVPALYLAENYIRTKVTGQNRTYLLQPIYRLMKLAVKKDSGNASVSRWFSVAACGFSLLSLYLVVSGAHLLLVFSVLTLMELFILAGAGSTGHLSGIMAAQRGRIRFAVWSFTAMVSASSLFRVIGTLSLEGIADFSRENILLLKLPLTFVALIIVLFMEGDIFYFNFGITGEGVTFLGDALYTPYSGWSLALMQFTRWMEIGVWLKLLSVFLPWQPWISFSVIAVFYLIMMILDVFTSGMDWKKVARNAWLLAGGLSALNFLWLTLF